MMEKPKNEMDLIGPAVDGTKFAMEAAIANKVKRVVITSSTVAMAYQKDPSNMKVNHESWTDTDCPLGRSAYNRSKTFAEKMAWDMKEKAGYDIEVCTVNPGLIMGPNYNSAKFTSGDIIKMCVENLFAMAPLVSIQTVDVRDVANAHL